MNYVKTFMKMKTIEERAINNAELNEFKDKVYEASVGSYILGAKEQRHIDIENCVKWCENFNKNAEKTGRIERIDVESFRQWITNMIMSDENN